MHVVTLYSSPARSSWLTASFFSLGLMFLLLLIGCGADSGGISIDPPPSSGGSNGGILIGPPPSGGGSSAGGGAPARLTVSVSLAWDPNPDSSVHAHFVHYGKASSGQSGSCHYSHSIHVTSNFATITGLEPDTLYYFAVSAYNGRHSLCSNEVSTVTRAGV